MSEVISASGDGAEPLNLEEFETIARARLPRFAYDYVAGGAEDERTVYRNRAAFGRFLLRPRALPGVAEPDLRTTALGQPVALPVLLAPTALHRLVHDEGELASARAAGAAGTIFVASTMATHSLEEIAGAASGPVWFQLYCYRDRELTAKLVRRAQAAGYRAICLTVDTPMLGRREREIRDHFALPAGLQLANFADSTRAGLPVLSEGSSLAAYIASQFDPLLNWGDVAWLRSLSDLPLVVKGVMTGDDAQRAVEAGADAIVVSNHGGRQLDSAPGTIEMLEEVVSAVQGRCEVYLDGGVRRGTDIIKALALGARAVLIGRPYLWGLAAGGEAGVRRVLEQLRIELSTSLMLCGCKDVASIEPSLLMAAPPL